MSALILDIFLLHAYNRPNLLRCAVSYNLEERMQRITHVGYDVDFTWIDWLRAHGLTAAAPVLQLALPHLAVEEIAAQMDRLSMALLTGGPEIRLQTTRRVNAAFARHVRSNARPGYGPPNECLWSQLSKSSLVCDENGVDPSKHYLTLVAAEHAFWKGVGENTQLYGDTAETIQMLRDAGMKMFALTSSDALVSLHPGTVQRPGSHPYYSAPNARKMKLARIGMSGLLEVFPEGDVIVCDPWHKEDLEVWNNRVFPRFPEATDRRCWAFVGDSRYDMVAAYKAGIGTRIFLNRHDLPMPEEANYLVYSLKQAADLILSLV
ncbi:MAG: hypothetical protein NT003_00890 [Candidatus Magasanikbacteria bacterium]|nr:hypothetical protein [Candidatus Magasanikbacteria bacterium]